MSKALVKNISISAEADPIADEFVDEILKCWKFSGKSFVARLVAVRGEELYFKTRDGRLMMDKRSSIDHMEVYRPSEAVV